MKLRRRHWCCTKIRR